MKADLALYFQLLSARLMVDVQAARLFASTTDTGSINEMAWRQVLKPLLPARYEVGVGEVIAPDAQDTERLAQSGQKDVLIYDPFASAVFGWDDSGLGLFPVESVYAAMEVKTCFHTTEDLRKAALQVSEVKRMQKKYSPSIESPFTVVFAFSTKISGNVVFQTVQALPVGERPDFTLFLGSQLGNEESKESGYVTHWHYVNRGPGEIGFVTADEAEDYRQGKDPRLMLLTLSKTQNALLWFYLFLVTRLQIMDNQIDRGRRPNLFRYAQSQKVDLGYVRNEPELGV